MMMQPSTTMIKILIFHNYLVFNEPHFVKKLQRNLRVFLLINVRWVDIFCTLTILLNLPPMYDGKTDRGQWIYSMRIDSAECFAYSFMYSNTQSGPKNLSIITFRMKKVDSLFLVRLHVHLRIQNSSCRLNVPMFISHVCVQVCMNTQGPPFQGSYIIAKMPTHDQNNRWK